MKWQTVFGCVEIAEQRLRLGRRGRQLRPFSLAAGVKHRGYSRRLQRALTDFGAEESFARATQRVREHYGIELAAQAVRQTVYHHGRKMGHLRAKEPPNRGKQIIITQMDGSMIPVMTPGIGPDGRQGKTVFWREARLCSARSGGRVNPVYGATLGSAETASYLWQETVQAAGLKHDTYVHGVGDGAGWIVEKFQDNFGRQGRYLLDFYHVSQYLGAAAVVVAGPKKARRWLRRQQGRLLENKWAQVLKALAAHREKPGQQETPVEDAHRYITERSDHLDFRGARQAGLPIGSGEIESAHRHVVQKRMKLAGSWWKETNAQIMLNLRVARANNLWDLYWSQN